MDPYQWQFGFTFGMLVCWSSRFVGPIPALFYRRLYLLHAGVDKPKVFLAREGLSSPIGRGADSVATEIVLASKV